MWPNVTPFFDPATWTWTYVVYAASGGAWAIVDPVLDSTIKIRQAGFRSCMDSRVMLATYLRRMRDLKMIP